MSGAEPPGAEQPAAEQPAAEPPVVDAALARRLIDSQFPAWAALPIRPVELDGWDNRTFRLGDALSIRLPSGPWYAEQVAKEQQWLPRLAPLLPLPIPVPVAAGDPDFGYPYPWSVYRWLDGRPAALDGIGHPVAFAEAVGSFLVALRSCPTDGAPRPGRHNFFRGDSPSVYGDETRAAIAALAAAGDPIDVAAATRVWAEAADATWHGDPVWFHGDIALGNLLMHDGALAAVIDFGTSGVGDPACDLALAWTTLDGEARDAYRRVLGVDDAMWARGKGWALWKALIMLRDDPRDAGARGTAERVLA
ncbi:aminoglycoside phosphotransferase family protein [Leifsonia sp. NCR5]|uniref:aminoglycoside phosphotransferase family protein n=1 Tax=Leifsonia sp. NCR5 TaxID=1978342 RepID=UPI000A199C34|nr:aminoglycoside phosphotransferase family protein [Leifsonia sp. NCR5]